MQRLALTLLLLLTTRLFAASVSGKVIDKVTGKPLGNMVVGIDGAFLTTRTEADGSFRLNNLEPGVYKLHISDGTYGTTKIQIKVKSDFYMEVPITRELFSTKPGIMSHDGTFADTRQRISYDDISMYPMRGVGDSLHLLQTLPGVGGGFSLASVPIIRGTNPTLTKYYVDGIPINHPYHFVGAFAPLMSAINQEVVDEAVLYKNDAPVWMSDSAGNVIDIRTKEADQPGFHGKVLMEPFAPALPTVYVSSIIDPNWSVVASGRRLMTDFLVDVEDNNYRMDDFYVKTVYTLDDNHRFTFSTLGASEKFQYEDFESESGFFLAGLTHDFYIKRSFFLSSTMSYYQTDRKLLNKEEDGANIQFDPAEFRLFQAANFAFNMFKFKTGYEFTRYMNGAESNVGLDELANSDGLETEASAETVEYSIEGNGIAFFAESSVSHKKLWADLGVKFEHFGVQNTNNVSYRSEFGYYVIPNLALYAKAARYIAHPDMLYYLGAVAVDSADEDGDGELTEPSELEDTITDSFAIGMKSDYLRNIIMQLEIYYTRFENMYPGGTYSSAENDEYRKAIQIHKFAKEDDGYNVGVELFLKGNYRRRYTGWVSYSYERTVRNESDSNFFVSTFGDDVKEIESEFSQNHIFRALVAGRWGRWNPSLIFHAYSSLPYTTVEKTGEIAGIDVIETGTENGERYDFHHRLDAKINYFYDDKSKMYLEIWNIYLNQNNVIADRENKTSDEVADLPIFVWAGMELCF